MNALVSLHDYKSGRIGRIAPQLSQAMQNTIDSFALIDLGFIGPPYTWTNGQSGSRMTAQRLDKPHFHLQIFPDSKIFHLQFNHSDHCPLLLNTRPSKENIKLHFHFLPIWADHEDCKEIVESTWGKQIPGSKARQVTFKLKECKIKLKEWNKKVFGRVEERLQRLQQKIHDLQSNLRTQRDKENLLYKQYDDWLEKEEHLWRVKFRELWLKAGDRNTKFFHQMVKYKRRTQDIEWIQGRNGEWLTNCNDITSIFEEAIKQVGNIDESSQFHRLDILDFPKLTYTQCQSLLSPPIAEEIKAALFQMHPHKAPGPDGYIAFFFQHYWSSLGTDIIQLVSDFFQSGQLVKEINNTCITFTPKCKNSERPSDYRPISLCNIIYKIITKWMANQMKPLL
uniref:Reverse transcriptase n=1 Tax=Nelumbo nucifera TaxID=4432 RepID=A0A822Z8L7_NELNU|nr:TPA_asm: hypothetical protein HUJ06_014128 [Nelumbo nucifera]